MFKTPPISTLGIDKLGIDNPDLIKEFNNCYFTRYSLEEDFMILMNGMPIRGMKSHTFGTIGGAKASVTQMLRYFISDYRRFLIDKHNLYWNSCKLEFDSTQLRNLLEDKGIISYVKVKDYKTCEN